MGCGQSTNSMQASSSAKTSTPAAAAKPAGFDVDGLAKTTGKPRLYYFGIYGRAEGIRMLLWYAKVDYENIGLSFEQWGQAKPTGWFPFNSMPVMAHPSGKKLAQNCAIIEHYATENGLMPKDPKMRFHARKVQEYFCNDYFFPHVDCLLDSSEARAEKVKKFIGELTPEFMKRLEGWLPETGFICGDLSYIDFQVGHIFVCLMGNDMATEKDQWAACFEAAPERVKTYAADFKAVMQPYLDTRPKCPC